MNYRNIFIFFILFFSIIQGVSSQDFSTSVRHYGVDEGLLGRAVNNIQQDANGLIWIATNRGLEFFDGTSFSPFIIGGHIQSVNISPEKEMWISKLKIDNKTGNSTKLYSTINIEDYSNSDEIFEDPNSKIKYLTHINQEHYIQLKKNGTGIISGKNNFSFDWPIASIDQLGDVIIFHQITYQKEKFWAVVEITNKKKNKKEVIQFDKNGNLEQQNFYGPSYRPLNINWSSNDNCEIIFYTPEGYKLYDINQSEWKNIPLILGTAGEESIVFENLKLNYLSSEKIDFYLLHTNIFAFDKSRNEIFSTVDQINLKVNYGNIFLDIHGNLWGASDNGLTFLNIKENLFKKILSDGERPYSCRRILAVDENTILVHTYDYTQKVSLVNGDNTDFNFYPGVNWGWDMLLLPDRSLVSSTNSEIYTKPSNLHAGDNGTKLNGLNKQLGAISHMLFDTTNQTLWVGGRNGFAYSEYQSGTLEEIVILDTVNKDIPKSVDFILKDNENLLVAANNGLLEISPTQKKVTNKWNITNDEQSIERIFHISKDANSVYWLSTNKGLIKWFKDIDSTVVFNAKHGFINTWLKCAYDDGNGNLWIPTERGLALFNKREETIELFMEEDGLPHNEFNYKSHFRDSQGRFYFGGLNGLVMFHPDSILNLQSKSKEYSVYVSDIQVFDSQDEIYRKKLPKYIEDGKLVIQPHEKAFQIDLRYLDYLRQDKIQYEYKFEGLDEEWKRQYSGNFYFGSLPYGEFNLNLRAKGMNASWSKIISIPLVVTRPFYLNPWFWAIAIIIIFSLFYWVLNYRWKLALKRNEELELKVQSRTLEIENQKNKLQELNKTNNKIFAILAHDLKGPIYSFTNLSKNLSYLINQKDLSRLATVSKSFEQKGNQIGHSISKILDWAISEKDTFQNNPVDVEILPLVNNLIRDFEYLIQRKSLDIQLSIPSTAQLFIDQNVFIIAARNLFSNAIKYSPAQGKIYISFNLENKEFSVSDEGQGVEDAIIQKIINDIPVQAESGSWGEKGTGIGLVTVNKLLSKNNFKLQFVRQNQRTIIGIIPDNIK